MHTCATAVVERFAILANRTFSVYGRSLLTSLRKETRAQVHRSLGKMAGFELVAK